MKHILLFGVLESKVCFYFSLAFLFFLFLDENTSLPLCSSCNIFGMKRFYWKLRQRVLAEALVFSKKTNLHRIALIVLIMEYETCNLPTEKFIWRKRALKFLVEVEHFLLYSFFSHQHTNLQFLQKLHHGIIRMWVLFLKIWNILLKHWRCVFK